MTSAALIIACLVLFIVVSWTIAIDDEIDQDQDEAGP